MALAPESRLILAYRKLVVDLEAMADTVARRGANPAYVEGQLRSARSALRDAIEAETEFVEQVLPAQYQAAAALAQGTLGAAGATIVEEGFTRFDRAAVRALQGRVSTDLAATREALTKGLALGDPRAVTKDLVAALGSDNALVRVQGGALKVATPAGQFWDPEAYARMLGRTAIADSRRVAFDERYQQNGVDIVVVVANGTTHDVCAAWEGERLSLTGATRGLPTVEDARADGLFHPNCRHRYVVDVDSLPAIPEQILESRTPEPALPILGRAPAETRVPAPSELGPARTAGLESRAPIPRG